MSKPYFSVVVPTRNRAQLLKYSIQSLLKQTFDDLEVIVSNNFSTDNTKEIVSGFGDKRVRYVETPESLGICESFEYAASFAEGEYVTFLSDDDACSLITLELIADVIENYKNNKLVVWSYCDYLLESNTVWVRSFTGEILTRNSKEAMKDRFAMCGLTTSPANESDHRKYPGLINAAYHKSIFPKIKNQGLNFFHPANPNCAVNDLFSLVITLHAVEEYLYIDYPLHLHTEWEKSATTTLDGARKYYKASKEEILTPFKCCTAKAFAANALLLGKKDLGENLDYIKIDWVRFFTTIYTEISEIKKVGADVAEDSAAFWDALKQMPEAIQKEIYSALPTKLQMSKAKLTHDIKELLRPVYKKSGLDKYANKARKNSSNSSFFLTGDKNGFDNILELAREIDKNWLEEFRAK